MLKFLFYLTDRRLKECHLASFKSAILNILGLLTPLDLKRLTRGQTTELEVELKMAAGAEFSPSRPGEWEQVKEAEARIISFPQNSPSPNPAMKTGNLESVGILSAEKQALLLREQQELEEKKKAEAEDFILMERHRFKQIEEKLHRQNGLSSYKKNTDMRLYQVVTADEEGKKKKKITSVLGVLIDKKQN
jgi:hypothetical protein